MMRFIRSSSDAEIMCQQKTIFRSALLRIWRGVYKREAMTSLFVFPLMFFTGSTISSGDCSPQVTMTLVTDSRLGDPARFGAEELARALGQKGVDVHRASDAARVDSGSVVWIGMTNQSVRLQELVSSSEIVIPLQPESYTVRRVEVEGKKILFVAGSDERGLMYGLLELVRQVEHSTSKDVEGLIGRLKEQTENPEVALRGMIHFVDSADLNRQWFYDQQNREAYLGMLARNRFNSFNLVFGHNNSYFAPPYPLFFNLK